MTDRTDPYEIIGVRRDASLAEIRISYRRSTQILAPERFANANDTVRAEAARRLTALNSAMEAIEAARAAESGSALGSLTFGGPAVSPAAEPSMRATAVADDPPPLEATQDGLDGHDRGVKVIARALRDAGMEVIYTGLRQTPEMIVNASLQEDVQVIGLSILSGAHNAIVPRVMDLLQQNKMDDVLVVVGGIIPDQDIEGLKKLGVAAIFQPGTPMDDIVKFIREHVKPHGVPAV